MGDDGCAGHIPRQKRVDGVGIIVDGDIGELPLQMVDADMHHFPSERLIQPVAFEQPVIECAFLRRCGTGQHLISAVKPGFRIVLASAVEICPSVLPLPFHLRFVIRERRGPGTEHGNDLFGVQAEEINARYALMLYIGPCVQFQEFMDIGKPWYIPEPQVLHIEREY